MKPERLAGALLSASNVLGAKPTPKRSAAAGSKPRSPRKSRPGSRLGRRQLLDEELCGRLRWRRAAAPGCRGRVACAAVFVVQLEADAGGHALDGLGEA